MPSACQFSGIHFLRGAPATSGQTPAITGIHVTVCPHSLWGGGVNTQKVLPFGTPAEVREQVLRRCEIFAKDGGFVFNTIHNIQPKTPTENLVAMLDALRHSTDSDQRHGRGVERVQTWTSSVQD